MIVKVCGLKDAENIKSLIPLRVDWVGLIFYEKSPRYIEADPNSIDFLKSPGGYTRGLDRVGVFVNASKEFILEKAKQYHLAGVQLHGEESALFCEFIKREGLFVIKAFSIDEAFSFRLHVAYEFACDYLLFDTKGKKRGGNGEQFNWELLENYSGEAPFVLSGGIGPDDIDQLKEFSHPKWAGIDINSQFEIAPGLKDIRKVQGFLAGLGTDFFRSSGQWFR